MIVGVEKITLIATILLREFQLGVKILWKILKSKMKTMENFHPKYYLSSNMKVHYYRRKHHLINH